MHPFFVLVLTFLIYTRLFTLLGSLHELVLVCRDLALHFLENNNNINQEICKKLEVTNRYDRHRGQYNLL